jgi:ribosomal protein S18 acetylase RimI-like enzyme
MNALVRQAGHEDRAFCRSTHHLAYHDVVVSQFGPWDERRQDEFFNAKWADGNFDIFVADGEPCGFVVVAEASDHLQVVEIVIHPAWQRRGIGTGFLRSMIARAADRGVPVRLRVLHKSRAVELYNRLGFTERGRSATHYELEWVPDRSRDGR